MNILQFIPLCCAALLAIGMIIYLIISLLTPDRGDK